jgi:hypothetical protein
MLSYSNRDRDKSGLAAACSLENGLHHSLHLRSHLFRRLVTLFRCHGLTLRVSTAKQKRVAYV